MATTAYIKKKYQKKHDDLTRAFYEKKRTVGVTAEEQEEFDTKHAKIWDDLDVELKTASDYVEPEPVRDLEAELDALKARVQELEKGANQ